MWKHQIIQQQQALTWSLSWAKTGNSSHSPHVDQSSFPQSSTPLNNITSYLSFSYITKLPLSPRGDRKVLWDRIFLKCLGMLSETITVIMKLEVFPPYQWHSVKCDYFEYCVLLTCYNTMADLRCLLACFLSLAPSPVQPIR